MAIEIQIRRDTAANWTSVDPILAQGEIGLETDTSKLKIGDGITAWTSLAYFGGGGGNPFNQDLNTTDNVVFNKTTLTAALVEKEVAAGFVSGTLSLDVNLASIFTHILTADVTTITIFNAPTTPKVVGFTLIFEADGTARSVTWPSDWKWPSGLAPTLTITAGKKDVFVLLSNSGYWLAFIAGQNL